MTEIKDSELPNNPVEAQGMLIKAFYMKFGKDALPLIREICGKQGRALGLKIKKKLPDTKLTTVAKAFAQTYDPSEVKIVSLSEDQFRIRGTACPFGLENTSRELCEAVMEIDCEYFRAAVSDKINLTITSTIAAGDSYCEASYMIGEEKKK
ncbi:MAG: hypothetical protein BAJALOKI1v1_2110005 [Promethearchaeota archaeon]|nr:MAG: hypothetical protein BAJALOKI1v1_2110005 [Candidatus Lokiarchaeota archaeon]